LINYYNNSKFKHKYESNEIFSKRLKIICAPLLPRENDKKKCLFTRENDNLELQDIFARFGNLQRQFGISNMKHERAVTFVQQNAAKINLNNWCGASNEESNFFKELDNSKILKPQKIFDFSTFEAKYRKLNDYDKTQSSEIHNQHFKNYRKINLLQDSIKLSNWVDSRKTLTIRIFDDTYYISVETHHKLGDLWKTMSKWFAVISNEIIIQNVDRRRPEEYLWQIVQESGCVFNVNFEQNDFIDDAYETILIDPRQLVFKNDNAKVQFSFHKHIKLNTVKKILLKQMKAEGFWIKFKLNENLYGDESRID
jgi:hypothetical protein